MPQNFLTRLIWPNDKLGISDGIYPDHPTAGEIWEVGQLRKIEDKKQRLDALDRLCLAFHGHPDYKLYKQKLDEEKSLPLCFFA